MALKEMFCSFMFLKLNSIIYTYTILIQDSTTSLQPLSTSNMTTCNVCVERFTKLTRRVTICDKCEFECCKQCFIRYITDPEHYLQCMGCREVFTRGYLATTMTKAFMKKEFQKIQSEIYFEKEKAFMEITQIKLEAISLKKEMAELKSMRSNSTDRKERRDLTLKMWDNEERLNEIKKATTTSTGKFPCVKAECRGIISYSSNTLDILRCGLCKTNVCIHCQSECDSEDHECDTNVIQNIKAIAQSSKACPTCSVRITRIDGCLQMFCTQCFTLFDYQTLKVETGFRHNPHYLTWVANNPERKNEVNQNVQESPDDKYLNFNALAMRNTISSCYEYMVRKIFLNTREDPQYADMYKTSTARLLNIYDWVNYWSHLVKWQRLTRIYDQEVNHLNRVKYLRNECTEEEFKKRIYRKYSELEYNRELIDVFFDVSRVITAMGTILRAQDTAENLEHFSTLLVGVENVVSFTSILLEKVQRNWMKQFDCKYTFYQEETKEEKKD